MMRVLVVFAVALLLSGCTWVKQELDPAPPVAAPTAKPDAVRPHKPHAERPAPPVQMAAPAAPIVAAPAPPPDYSARCHAMAENRAADARGLGASAADQAKMQTDTYRDCMAQSVK